MVTELHAGSVHARIAPCTVSATVQYSAEPSLTSAVISSSLTTMSASAAEPVIGRRQICSSVDQYTLVASTAIANTLSVLPPTGVSGLQPGSVHDDRPPPPFSRSPLAT